jgi:hypothetical protein
LENNLLNPFQCLRILDPSVNDESHSILFPNEDLKIPLQLNGIVSYFPSRRPTKEEYDQCSHIELTSTEPEWNPHNGVYSKGESGMTGDNGNILKRVRPSVRTREIMGTWTSENMAKSDDPFLESLK